MGVINLQWYKDRGLTKRVTRTLTEDSKLTGRKAGESFEYDEIIQEYSCGRIDCRGGDLGPYGAEISLPPMLAEDWGRFSNWLNTFETDAMWNLKDIIELYERKNPKITWAEGYEE
jgi:hypothetical protein